MNQFCTFSFHDFVFFCKLIKSASEKVDKINELIGQKLTFVDLLPLKLLRPGQVLSSVKYHTVPEDDPNYDKEVEKMNTINRVSAFRSLNSISQDMVTLRERGIDIVPDPMIYEIHPISILPQVIGLRNSIRNLEVKLFQYVQSFGEVSDHSIFCIFDSSEMNLS